MRFLILFAVLVNSVLSDESDVNVKARYNFNHPPSVEFYNPVPVAVVYEETGIKGKSIGDSEDAPKEDVTTETDIPITTNAPLKVSLVSHKTSGLDATKPGTLDHFQQIPVQVVYDTEPTNPNQQPTMPNKNAKPLLKRRLKQRRQQRPKPTTKTELITDVTTENVKIEISSENIINVAPAQSISMKIKTTRERDPVVPIVESENYVFSHNGNFRYSYEGGDGTRAFSEGQLRKIEDDAGEAVVGGFSYTDKEGNDFSLSYTADENGYRPVGAHLPTPPPIPPEIARALEYLATATTPKPVTKPADE